MKKYRFQIVLLAIAVILAVSYFLLISIQRESNIDQVFKLKKNESIENISISNQYGNFKLEKNGDEWVVVEPGNYKMNPQKASLIVGFLENMYVRRAIDGQLPEYGLDAPHTQISFKTSKNNTYQIDIGNLTMSQNQYYAKSDSKFTYLIDAGIISQFDASIAAFRDNNIFSIDPSKVKKIRYKDDSHESLVLEQKNDTWQINEPFASGARDIEINEFLSKFKRISVADYADSLEDLSKTGLLEPMETITLETQNGQTQTFEFGDYDESFRYVKTNGFIYKVYVVDIDFTNMSAEKLIFEVPLKLPVNTIESFEFKMGELGYKFNMDEDNDEYYMNGNEISKEKYITVYVKYISIMADGFEVFDPKDKELVAYLETVIDQTNSIRVSIYSKNEEQYYMAINNNSSYVISKERIENLIYWINKDDY